ncbi:MAG: Gfo/Idh/MocA family protein, partial [Micromonosporaceae bacterium]
GAHRARKICGHAGVDPGVGGPPHADKGQLRLGIAGLGIAGSVLVPHVEARPDFALTAGADPNPAVRDGFAAPGRVAYSSVTELCCADDVDVVYVATPTPCHAEHAIAALRGGKHVIVEKPMAVSMADAEAMIAEAEAADRLLVVGHSQSFEAPIRAMRAVVESGVLGPMRAINALYYTDWMYRPRHPDELDPAKGGGVPFRQAAHHVDIIRYLGGGELRSVRGRIGCWDPERRGAGSYTAYLEFVDGTPATVAYSGYDHFPSTELTFGIGEAGQVLNGYAVARRRLAAGADEASEKRGATGVSRQQELLRGGEHQPFFGFVLASCEHGDIRVSPQGLLVYADAARVEIPLAGHPTGRQALLDEAAHSVDAGEPPLHDGQWGLANLEVCTALVESSAIRAEVRLTRQKALSGGPDLPDVVAAATRGVEGGGFGSERSTGRQPTADTGRRTTDQPRSNCAGGSGRQPRGDCFPQS